MLNQFGDIDDPMAANFLAWTGSLAADAMDDYDPAVALAEKAANAQPDSKQFLNTLGAVLYRAGRLEEAIERLTELDRRLENPDHKDQTSPAYSWYFLAMAHKKAGNEGEAQEYLKKAIKRTDEVLDEKGIALLTHGGWAAWDRPATLVLLRKEAEALLGTDVPGLAAENQKPEEEQE